MRGRGDEWRAQLGVDPTYWPWQRTCRLKYLAAGGLLLLLFFFFVFFFYPSLFAPLTHFPSVPFLVGRRRRLLPPSLSD